MVIDISLSFALHFERLWRTPSTVGQLIAEVGKLTDATDLIITISNLDGAPSQK